MNTFIDLVLTNNFTMVSKNRLVNLYNQCQKFKDTNYSFVECGVANGGCLALMKYCSNNNNKIFGLDSFDVMPDIGPNDLDNHNKGNPKDWVGKNLTTGISGIKLTFKKLNVNMDNVKLIEGYFENTLNNEDNIDKIGDIAILRLDADWYEPTKICLEKLYNKVIKGGVIIIDDYGHWAGAKNATDEFRKLNNINSPLIQTDYTEFYWIK